MTISFFTARLSSNRRNTESEPSSKIELVISVFKGTVLTITIAIDVVKQYPGKGSCVETYLMEERRVREREVEAEPRAGAERHVVGRGGAGACAARQRPRRACAQRGPAAARYVVVA